jgi:hypothetical protein
MTHDPFWFIDWSAYHDVLPAIWLMNQRLQVHRLGFGFKEAAD